MKVANGAGEAKMQKILNSVEEMEGKGRLFNHVTLEKGCEVGYHMHNGDAETYYVLKGHAMYNDNGTIVEIGPGDVTYCGDGECHGAINNNDEPFEMIALILYTK